MRIIKRAEWRGLAVAVVLAGSTAACIGSGDVTETSSGALLTNVSYKSGGVALQARTGTDPWGTMFGSGVYFSYVHPDTTIGIIFETDLGNGTGQHATFYNLPDTTNNGASLVAYQGLLYLFYVGGDGFLYMRRSGNPVNAASWDGPYRIFSNGGFSFTPAPAVWNGELALLVVGNSFIFLGVLDGQDTYLSLFNYTNETTNNTVAASTSSFDSNLYMSWAGTQSNKPIYIKHLDTSWNWSSPVNIPNNWGRPALFTVSAGELAIAYRGNNAHIYRIYSWDGVNFGGAIADNASTTNQTPIPIFQWGPTDFQVLYIGQNGQVYTALE